MLPLALLALSLATQPAHAQTAGSIVEVGDTLVSAMMMFLGNDQKVYIMDKVEGNKQQIDGHPAWASVWDIATHTATPMDFSSNAFCSSGLHLPNGSFVTFGGNGAIGPGGNIGSVTYPGGGAGQFDATYQDYDGSTAIRVLNPCTGTISPTDVNCQWFDNAAVLAMQKKRWYSAAEALGDGSIAIIGGFVNGGYINRNYPNTDPEFEGGAAEPTYEFYPSKGPAQVMNFMIKTSGLNAYAHTFLLPSGRMFVQANFSSMVWDPASNTETDLPDMPGQVIRVYPASGAVAMLPLTPANNYTPTIIFCGGSDMPDEAWGDYSYPSINTWDYPASRDCQRITPEPTDGSPAAYVQDDDMMDTRTMGQFIILPNGKMLVVNGAENGTAGYATQTLLTTSYSQMPFGMSLSAGPVGTPAIYDPNAPAGSRWSNTGLATSSIPRLYHSSAILLPDGSVMIAGSNPNVDVNLTTIFPTTYTAEVFYPPYFASKTRPVPIGLPTSISYGGPSFDITIPADSYTGSANDAADNTTVVLIRPGWTTHAMNMGQRFVQLNNTYTVNADGSIMIHCSQAPPNPNILTPGPVLIFVVVNGIPSNGTMVIVGNGQVGTQPVSDAAVLPPNVRVDSASGTGTGTSSGSGSGGGSTTTKASGNNTASIVGGIVGAVAVISILGVVVGVCIARRRRAARQTPESAAYAMNTTGMRSAPPLAGGMKVNYNPAMRTSDSSFMPLHQNASAVSVGDHYNYRDDAGYNTQQTSHTEYDPYYDQYGRAK